MLELGFSHARDATRARRSVQKYALAGSTPATRAVELAAIVPTTFARRPPILNPFRFGSVDRELLGLLHSPPSALARGDAILVCNPFGQEAVRCHRLMRILADQLARRGFHVMRFDYYGTGDSGGEDDAGELSGWRRDILAADAELASRCPGTKRHWLGFRLGAALAAQASQLATSPPAKLLLWDPVIDGTGYVAELKAAHVASIAMDYGYHWSLDSALRAHVEASSASENLGFPFTPALQSQLAELTPAAVAPALADKLLVHIAGERQKTALRDAFARAGRAADIYTTNDGITWASIEAMSTSIVPPNVLSAIVAAFET